MNDLLRTAVLALPAAWALAAAFWGGPAMGFRAAPMGAWQLAVWSLVTLGLLAWWRGGGRDGLSRWLDPLALSASSRPVVSRLETLRLLLPWALVLWVLLSWSLSPTPRAGSLAVLLLPLLLLLPGRLAAALRWGGDRGAISSWLAVAVIVVSSFAWVGRKLQGLERAADPLGHPVSLSLWLLPLLPVALLEARRPGPGRWLAAAAGLSGVAALAATRSMAGLVAFAAVAGGGVILLGLARGAGESSNSSVPGASTRGSPIRGSFIRGSSIRRWLPGLLVPLLVLAAATPRLLAALRGQDFSTLLHFSYWRAGLEGFLHRPFVGWGPGASPWTLGQWVVPQPGLHPPGQLVGDLHSLPLTLLYELGLPGLLLACLLVLTFIQRRWRLSADPIFTLACLAGAGAFAIASLGGAPLALPSVWMGVLLPMALALAADRTSSPKPSDAASETSGWRHFGFSMAPVVGLGLLALAALLLWPGWRAHHHWQQLSDKAMGSSLGESELGLLSALRLDPDFPLYRAAGALLVAEAQTPGRAGAGQLDTLLSVAEDAPGVTPLWVAAGWRLSEAGDPRAQGALERACRQDPLLPLPSFALALGSQDPELAVSHLARALLAEPRLAAARELLNHQQLLAAAALAIQRDEGVELGWRDAFRRALERRRELVAAGAGQSSRGDLSFDLMMDGDELSASVFLFRRPPVPQRLASVVLVGELLEALELPAPARLPRTTSRRLTAEDCRPPA
ncbi:MAG: hypothetical protein AAGD01_16365 [Acidobacteriota bacterium]